MSGNIKRTLDFAKNENDSMIHDQFEEISSNELMNFGGISVEFHHSIMFTHENVSVK